jgi:eukaryotic-like serine/threonine-protein kinase
VAQRGDYFGMYRLLNPAGNGRHCDVWEAMHDGKNERFAVKIIKSDYRNDGTQINLMKHEFAVGRELSHPNVITIFEFDSSKIAPFIAMEFFAAATNLKKLISPSAQTIGSAVSGLERIARQIPKIIDQAAAGLAYFHERGWIHRDIKPDNFLVNPAADVKLIDYAIAERRRGLLGRLFGKTQIAGTRSYMSPEQIRGQSLDHRTDIYSFGCVMFELFAGKPPYTGNSENELLNKHLRAPIPSAETYNKYLTYECVQLVKAMLAKDPADRPVSMDEVLGYLRANRVYRSMPAPKA